MALAILDETEIVDEKTGIDIWQDWDFNEVYEHEQDERILNAYWFIALLRAQCYNAARLFNVGSKSSNLTKETDSAMWGRKLYDKMTAVSLGRTVRHDWIH